MSERCTKCGGVKTASVKITFENRPRLGGWNVLADGEHIGSISKIMATKPMRETGPGYRKDYDRWVVGGYIVHVADSPQEDFLSLGRNTKAYSVMRDAKKRAKELAVEAVESGWEGDAPRIVHYELSGNEIRWSGGRRKIQRPGF